MNRVPAGIERCTQIPPIGARLSSARAELVYVSHTSYEINVDAPRDLVTTGLAMFNVAVARNSDKVSQVQYQAGSCLFAPAGSTNYARCTDGRSNFVMFAVDPSIRSELEDELGGQPLGGSHMEFHGGRRSEALAASAAQYAVQGGLGSAIAVEGLALASLISALRIISGETRFEKAYRPNLNERSMNRARDYIHAHLAEDLSLTDIASAAAMSPYHFSRSFKAAHGQGVTAYISEQRIERVKELMTTTDWTLAEISYAAGFSSQSRMSTVFRGLVGTTPRNYRNENSD